MAIQTINPATGQLVKRFRPYSEKAIDRALQESREAFFIWRALTFDQRREYMLRAAGVLRRGKQAYAKIITREVGKPISQSLAEIEKCAGACEYFAANAATFLADQQVATEYKKSYVRFEPLGPILAVMPWNFPFWQVFRFAAPALMAGNTGILKHASNVPLSTLAIEEVFVKAGFPAGVFRSLLLESGGVKSLIKDDRIAAVTLTGSEKAGSEVAAAAGRAIKKSVLELGGSDPFIVLRDAAVSQACDAAVQARTINTGQSCIAAKRFIVDKPIAKRFSRLFAKKMSSLKVGNPLDPKTQVGPLARKDLREGLDRQVQMSIKKGAKLLTGGKFLTGKGFYYAPTVLTDVRPGMPAYDEELFGPVASVIEVRNSAEAVRVANDSRFGLGANVWSKNIRKAEKIAQQLEAGAVFINDFVKSDARLPFGGVKKSGYGRELSSYGIKEFVNIKTIVVKG